MKRLLFATVLLFASLAMAQDKPTVIGNPTSMIYHLAICPHYHTCKACTAGFDTEETAVKAGYARCPFAPKPKKQ